MPTLRPKATKEGNEAVAKLKRIGRNPAHVPAHNPGRVTREEEVEDEKFVDDLLKEIGREPYQPRFKPTLKKKR